MRIIIQVDDWKDITEHELKFLLCDALYEFQKARSQGYVQKRYPWYTPEQKDVKVMQTERRKEQSTSAMRWRVEVFLLKCKKLRS